MARSNHDIEIEQLPVVQFDGREQDIINHVAALRDLTYDPIAGGRVHGDQTRRDAHRTGTMGEAAVAKFLGNLDLYDLTAMVPLGDGGIDFRVHGTTLDVKATQTDMEIPDLLVPEKPTPRADLYFLTHVLDERRVRLIGMASKDTVVDHPVRRAPGDRRNYWIPPQNLTLFTR